MISIFVWWIGEREADRELLEHVRFHLAAAFGRPVFLWESPERPRHAYDEKRKQWRTAPILKWLLEQGPGAGKVLGITDQDLFIPILTFVFGEAQLGGAAAVVSTARLTEPAPRPDPRLFAERVAKECVHELGHAMGLVHCGTPLCAMGRSASVRDVDRKSGGLCDDCRARLRAMARGVAT